MDISSASSVSALSGQSVGNSLENSPLRKAQEVQGQNPAALIKATQLETQSTSANLPAHLGQNVNTKA